MPFVAPSCVSDPLMTRTGATLPSRALGEDQNRVGRCLNRHDVDPAIAGRRLKASSSELCARAADDARRPQVLFHRRVCIEHQISNDLLVRCVVRSARARRYCAGRRPRDRSDSLPSTRFPRADRAACRFSGRRTAPRCHCNRRARSCRRAETSGFAARASCGAPNGVEGENAAVPPAP